METHKLFVVEHFRTVFLGYGFNSIPFRKVLKEERQTQKNKVTKIDYNDNNNNDDSNNT